jgi:hypothetical protein
VGSLVRSNLGTRAQSLNHALERSPGWWSRLGVVL